MTKNQDVTAWLQDNLQYKKELNIINKAMNCAKKELRQERKKWSAFNYKLANLN